MGKKGKERRGIRWFWPGKDGRNNARTMLGTGDTGSRTFESVLFRGYANRGSRGREIDFCSVVERKVDGRTNVRLCDTRLQFTRLSGIRIGNVSRSCATIPEKRGLSKVPR